MLMYPQRLREFLCAYETRDLSSYETLDGDEMDTYLCTYSLFGCDQQSECCYQQPLEFQCLWFRESAFGEWQALIGIPFGRVDTQRLLKVILERRHDIGAPCNCDGGQCAKRFAEDIARSRLRLTLAESYATAANTIIGLMDHGGTLATDTDAVLSRLFRARPDPFYVQEHVLPRLRECDSEFDMYKLLEDAPKLSGKERQWAANFYIGPRINPLINPAASWDFEFGQEDGDSVLPGLL